MTFEEIAAALRERLATLEPNCYSGADAARHAEVAAEIRNLGETATVLLAKRAADTGGWTRTSHAVSAEQWLANIAGSSEYAARETLMTADRLSGLPATTQKLRAGELSLAQAHQVTAAAAVDPGAEDRMLRATTRGFRELRATKERMVAAASEEDRLRRMAKDERHLVGWTRGLATHGSFSGPTEDVADLFATLEPLAKAAFEAARKAGDHQPLAAYRFDALVALARGTATGGAKRPEPVVRVRVGLDKLLGKPATGVEYVCEIPGVGPVPVAHAREVLSHGLLELVITDGVDVQTVVSTTRHVPKALKIAIDERDGGVCKVRDCDHTRATERHHTLGFANNKTTSYQVLGDVCPDHHDLITHRGYEVIDNHDGTWSLRAPPHSSAA
ncbi:MAG: hypothetical protein WD598_02450 [Acidimicrobiia bacterium]